MLLCLFLLLFYHLYVFGKVLWYCRVNPQQSAFMTRELARLRQTNPKAEIFHIWVPYEKISNNVKRAIVASEDAKFLEHEGFDWEAMQDAWEKNRKKGRIVAGGSTISQQLAKNLFLSSSRSKIRKAEEAVITVMIEQVLSKKRILEIYMNVVEWGDGVFGIEAAARHYYNKSAGKLTTSQAARLASMLPRPKYYDSHPNSRALSRKAGIIERRMRYAEVP
ncbi:MAG: monofunctional biosynthetic peptidoglycan transglycosylase [Thermodesulfobacteriota bacterium]